MVAPSCSSGDLIASWTKAVRKVATTTPLCMLDQYRHHDKTIRWLPFLGFKSRRAQLRWNGRPHLLNNCGRFMSDYRRRPSSLMLSSQLPLTIWPQRSRKSIPSMFPSLRLMRFLCSPGKPILLVVYLPRSWRLKTSPLTPGDKHVRFQREAYIANLLTAPCLSS